MVKKIAFIGKEPGKRKMKQKLVKCAICRKEELDWNMYDLETPNFIFQICLDCGIELESKIEELGK